MSLSHQGIGPVVLVVADSVESVDMKSFSFSFSQDEQHEWLMCFFASAELEQKGSKALESVTTVANWIIGCFTFYSTVVG